MSIRSQIDRINNAKSEIASAISSKGVTVPANASIDDMAEYIEQITGGSGEVSNADKVDGWHIAVINKGEAVPTTQTICFVRGG